MMKRMSCMLVLFIAMFSFLDGDVWDFYNGTGDWMCSQYRFYDQGEEYLCSSPFYSDFPSHLDDISLHGDSDFRPEDGWNLYCAYFGEPNQLIEGFPFFALYNRHTGLLRVFMLKWIQDPYSYIALDVGYDGNTTLFGMGEFNCDNTGIKALNLRDEISDCSFLRIVDSYTANYPWYYVDIQLLYDPVNRPTDPKIKVTMYGSQISNIDLHMELFGQVTSQNSGSLDLLSMGDKVISTITDGADLSNQINEIVTCAADESNPCLGSKEIKAEGAVNRLAQWMLISGAESFISNVVPFGFVAASLWDVFSIGGSSASTTSFHLSGDITGTMENIQSLVQTNVFESISGSRVFDPLYSETMGVQQLDNSPMFEGGWLWNYSPWDDNIAFYNFHVTSEAPAVVVNPAAGVSLAEAPNAAIEFTLSYETENEEYIMALFEDHLGVTWDEFSWLTGFTEIRAEIGSGVTTRVYSSAFFPLNELQGVAIACPTYPLNVKVKVETIFNVDDNPQALPIYNLTSYAASMNNIGDLWGNNYQFVDTQLIRTVWEDRVIAGEEEYDVNNHRVSVIGGACLTYDCSDIDISDATHGITVYDGEVKFVLCDVHLSGGYLEAIGEGSTISLYNSTLHISYPNVMNLLSNGAKLELNNSSLIIDSGSVVNISGGSEISAANSIVELNSSGIRMNGGSLVSIGEGSSFYTSGNAEIKGETTHYYYDPASGGGDIMYGAEVEVPGDRIVFDGCDYVHIDSGTSIWGPTRWDGLSFKNCGFPNSNPERCIVEGTIYNVNWVKVDNALLSLRNASMMCCGQLSAKNGAKLYLNNYDYSMNDCGIYVEESVIGFASVQIHGNGSSGLAVNYPSTGLGYIHASDIYDNEGSGVEMRNAFLNINGLTEGSEIHNNDMYGVLSLGTIPSHIGGGSSIYNNGSAELIALYDCFPVFHQHTQLPLPSVIDNDGYVEGPDQYLLAAVGQVEDPLDVTNLAVDTSDECRFFPSYEDYVFGSQTQYGAELIFAAALDSIYTKSYESAYLLMRSICDEYADTPTAKKALPYLPYLNLAMGGDPQELLDYLAAIDEAALQDLKIETEAVCYLSIQEYDAAIEKLEMIIADPPNDEKQLLAELDEAYSYYKLASTEERNLPEQCHRKPRTALEYSAMRSEIIEELVTLGTDQGGSDVPTVLSLGANYPNPFNPTTTIQFSLPEDSMVSLTVYNIRGRRVATLVDDALTSGYHTAVWNGQNANGQSVSSGVYFYRLKAGGKTITNKMLLLK